ncbi:DUF998 domain-containing protein [Jiangella gansuensis]|uniref:DUF998 domain-containing protein n=1 Tax=Jiangella gansuensis TaxID=281473 RepID=UPI00047D261E|nr:DUF998 domain-containing protein [Jiangella gansuensis]
MTGAVGMSAAVAFVVVFTLDGSTRPGYRPMYHPVSALALGSRGWLQTANFLLCGAGVVVGAAGLWPDHRWVALALGMLGLALVASGVWPMDPMRAYPPGTPATTPSSYSRRHQLHDHAGAVVFLGFPVVAVVAALGGLDSWLRVYSAATAVACALLAGAFSTAWERDAPRTGGWQRLFLVTGCAWLAVLFATA